MASCSCTHFVSQPFFLPKQSQNALVPDGNLNPINKSSAPLLEWNICCCNLSPSFSSACVSHQYRIKPELHTWEVSTWASSLHAKTLASKPCFFFFSFLLLLSHWRYSALQHQLNRCEINLQRSSILLGTWQWEHCETDWDTCCVSFSCVCFYFYLSTLLI